MEKKMVTRIGYEKLESEIKRIDEEIQKTNIRMGESVKLDNDLRENPEFMDLRYKAMYVLPKQKEELQRVLKNVTIIEDTDEYKNFDGKTVIPCAKVVITIDGDDEEYSILGYGETDIDNGIISYDAPIVQAIMGKHVGDVVSFNGMQIIIKSVTRI